MHGRFSDRADFYSIYIREAHPSDGWQTPDNIRAGIEIATARTLKDRVEAASHCCDSLNMSVPLLIDGIDDAVGNRYSGFPDRLYLIDSQGKIAYKGGRGPFGFIPAELEQTLVMLLMQEQAAESAASEKDSATEVTDADGGTPTDGESAAGGADTDK